MSRPVEEINKEYTELALKLGEKSYYIAVKEEEVQQLTLEKDQIAEKMKKLSKEEWVALNKKAKEAQPLPKTEEIPQTQDAVNEVL